MDYLSLWFDQVSSVDDETGAMSFKLPAEAMVKLEEFCRIELGKNPQTGADLPPRRPALDEQINDTQSLIDFYSDQLLVLEHSDFDDDMYEKAKEYWQLKILFADIELASLQAKKRRKQKVKNFEKLPDAEEIKRNIDIVGVIEQYTPLKKSGKEYLGRCIFHPDKTPSFAVNPEKQLFFCHGCRVGGSVIDFVMKAEGIDFQSALKRLSG